MNKDIRLQRNERLREERLRRGWSQQEVADRLQTTVVTVNRWEQGVQKPGAYFRAKLCTLFGTNEVALGLSEYAKAASDRPSSEAEQEEAATAAIAEHYEQIQQPLDQTARSPFHSLQQTYQTLFSRARPLTVSLILLLVIFVVGIPIAVISIMHNAGPTSAHSSKYTAPNSSSAAITPTTTPGKLTLNDPLTQQTEDGQWATGTGCKFVQGTYQITSVGANFCSEGAQPFTNMVYQTAMILQQGTWAGIVFRADADNHMYYFSINAIGQYEIDVLLPLSSPNYVSLLQGNSHTIVTGYNHTNILKVEANNTLLSFWINGSRIGQIHDSTYTHGYVGVCAGYYKNPADPTTTKAAFRNAQVWQLP